MNTVVAVVLLILGLLLALVWGVNLLVQILGWVLVAVAVIWLINYLSGSRRNT